jgi:hypothetical protein
VIRWVFGGAFGLIVAILIIIFLGGLLIGGCSVITSSQYDSTGVTPTIFGITLVPMLCAIPTLLVVLLIMGAFTIGFPWLLHRYIDQSYQKRFSQWQRAINIYNSLYFYSRCAGVFLASQNRIVPIEQMQSFLYEVQTAQRCMALFAALAGQSYIPRLLANRSLRLTVAQLLGREPKEYTSAQMTHDLRRLRLKGMVERIGNSHRYHLTVLGIKVVTFFTKLYQRLFRPGLAALLPEQLYQSELAQALKHVAEIVQTWTERAHLAAMTS